jgi:DNA-3-methyladenine glycosylase
MKRLLPGTFFARPALPVARDLLGKYLVRRLGGKTRAYMIVETEAYGGPQDKASHARAGKTKRNWPMFEPGGTIYVYFTYGMHWMLNISTGKHGTPSAVLIRAVQPTDDADTREFNGPAKLTKRLRIDGRVTGKSLGRQAGLWVEDRGVRIRPKDVRRTPRIGVEYAGEWGSKPWRFVVVRSWREAKS